MNSNEDDQKTKTFTKLGQTEKFATSMTKIHNSQLKVSNAHNWNCVLKRSAHHHKFVLARQGMGMMEFQWDDCMTMLLTIIKSLHQLCMHHLKCQQNVLKATINTSIHHNLIDILRKVKTKGHKMTKHANDEHHFVLVGVKIPMHGSLSKSSWGKFVHPSSLMAIWIATFCWKPNEMCAWCDQECVRRTEHNEPDNVSLPTSCESRRHITIAWASLSHTNCCHPFCESVQLHVSVGWRIGLAILSDLCHCCHTLLLPPGGNPVPHTQAALAQLCVQLTVSLPNGWIHSCTFKFEFDEFVCGHVGLFVSPNTSEIWGYNERTERKKSSIYISRTFNPLGRI